jgi:D-lactate dehydrogenase (cytochrome)
VTHCAESRVPVIPFGTGTSLEGQVNAPFGGISLDLSRMNRVLAVHEEDLDCVVEPGVTRKALNDHLRDLGVFFPIDPGADASLGGMAATRASGTNAVRYGTMRDNVLSLVAVMADGALLRTGSRARKSSSGYDLTRLLVGSEGTLGIITELTLRLAGIPETIRSAVCPFATIESVCNATIAAMQMGLPLARIELADEVQIRACNAYSHLTLGEQPTLFLEFHGTAASAREQVGTFADIARGEGAGDFRWAERPEERTKLWQARHDAYWAARGLRPGAEVVTTDVCVPISALAACVGETRADIERTGLLAPIVGQFPCHAAVRCEQRPRPMRGARLPRPAGRAHASHGGHLLRRARRRPGQDPLSRQGARDRGRCDDCHKKGARPVEYSQPWQDLCVTMTELAGGLDRMVPGFAITLRECSRVSLRHRLP